MKNKITAYIVAAILCFAVVIQGGFQLNLISFLCIILSAYLVVFLKSIPKNLYRSPFFIIALVYLLSSLLSDCPMDALYEALRPISVLLFFIILEDADNLEPYPQLIIKIGLLTVFVGLLSYTRVLPLQGFEVSNRLQSVFQYANTAGLFWGVCAFIANMSPKKNTLVMPIFFEAALFLSQSAGAVIIYGLGLIAYIVFQKTEKKLQLSLENIQRMALSSGLTIAIYICSVKLNIGFAALIFGIIIFAAAKPIDKALRSLFGFKLSKIAAVILVVIGLAFIIYSRGGSPFQTFIERIIQIQDGFMIILRHPLLGIGPGIFENTYAQWQSSGYTAQSIHSGYMQLMVDSGMLAVPVIIVSIVLWLRKNPVLDYAIPVMMILTHAVLDIDFLFLGIDFLLIILLKLSVSPEPGVRVSKGKVKPVKAFRLPNALCLLPLGFGMVMFFGYLNINLSGWETLAGNNEKAVSLVENSLAYRFDSYKAYRTLAADFMKDGQYERALSLVPPYDTSEVYLLKASALTRRGRYAEAMESALSGISLSPYQADGYTLADEILSHLPADEEQLARQKVENIRDNARALENPLSKYIGF